MSCSQALTTAIGDRVLKTEKGAHCKSWWRWQVRGLEQPWTRDIIRRPPPPRTTEPLPKVPAKPSAAKSGARDWSRRHAESELHGQSSRTPFGRVDRHRSAVLESCSFEGSNRSPCFQNPQRRSVIAHAETNSTRVSSSDLPIWSARTLPH